MSIVLGVDVGGSTTKIVGFEGGTLAGTLQVRANDQITSLFGAVGHFLREFGFTLGDVTRVALTGVGATFFDEDIFGINTRKVDEFTAIAHGALYLSGLNEALVVSLGTGTAFVRASGGGSENFKALHIGGSGVGGGTLVGLASQLLGKNDIEAVLKLAEIGELRNVDLMVSDIIGRDIPSLPPNLTASNFGKIKSTASEADLALGIINMVLQTAGMLAVFAAQSGTIKDIVLTGTLTTIPQAGNTTSALSKIHGLNFIIPPNAVFATAIGAALEL